MSSRRQFVLHVLVVGPLLCSQIRAEDIIPFGSDWSFLAPVTIDDDPNSEDGDFDSTWFLPGYDTSTPIEWNEPSPGPLGFGTINGFVDGFATELEAPFDGERYSAYFRHEFTTISPASGLALELLADDGAKIYLDGQEVLAFNCCEFAVPGEIATHDEFATVTGNEDGFTTVGILPGETLPAGDHILAVGMHQAAATSSDMGLSLRMFDQFVPPEPPVEIMGPGGAWKYFEGFEEPSDETLAWTNVGFDDASWDVGDEGFGYERDQVGGVLPLVETELLDMEGSYTTLYLRKEFSVEDAAEFDELILNIDYDDAFFAYVNGELVFSSNAVPNGDPTAAIPFDTNASDPNLDFNHESSNGNGTGELFSVSLRDFPGLLQNGDGNIIAIQGLNRDPSSDFVLAQIGLFGQDSGAGPSVPGDFDDDGDLDVDDIDALSTEINAGGNDLRFDVTNDGVVDTDDHTEWVHELKRTYFGDANLDGQFNSNDFVKVFTVGEYEDDVTGNSGWGDGDWNADLEFNTRDFVAAFQDGGWEAGPRVSVQAVPEPSGLILLLVGVLCFLPRRRNA